MSEEKKLDYDGILEKLEKDLTTKQKVWSDVIKKLSNRITCELKKSVDLSADATCQRQLLIDERTHWYFKMYRDLPKLKQIRKTYFEYYSGKYPYKVNGTEKQKLIDADVAYQDAKMDYLQNYINFLSESVKTVDHIIYSVKNKIELYNATGLD
jgi:hypothetical protein